MNCGAASWQGVMPLLAPHVRVAAYDQGLRALVRQPQQRILSRPARDPQILRQPCVSHRVKAEPRPQPPRMRVSRPPQVNRRLRRRQPRRHYLLRAHLRDMSKQQLRDRLSPGPRRRLVADRGRAHMLGHLRILQQPAQDLLRPRYDHPARVGAMRQRSCVPRLERRPRAPQRRAVPFVSLATAAPAPGQRSYASLLICGPEGVQAARDQRSRAAADEMAELGQEMGL